MPFSHNTQAPFLHHHRVIRDPRSAHIMPRRGRSMICAYARKPWSACSASMLYLHHHITRCCVTRQETVDVLQESIGEPNSDKLKAGLHAAWRELKVSPHQQQQLGDSVCVPLRCQDYRTSPIPVSSQLTSNHADSEPSCLTRTPGGKACASSCQAARSEGMLQ